MNRFLKITTMVACGVLLTHATVSASVKKVTGTYTYYGDKNDSPAMSMRKALEGARLAALSKEFGTIVSQDIMQADRVGSDGEGSKFFSLSATEVKGEWIADDGEPVYTVSLGKDNCLIVDCTVKGAAKEISNASIDFEALALRNGKTKGNAATEYHTEDELFLHFTAPTDGYMAVYLMDETGDVIQMFPYYTNPDQEAKVKKDRDYLFFDETKTAGEFGEPMGFKISTKGEIEFNKLYVVFSPNVFSRPVMHKPRNPEELPLPYLTEEEFSKWLVKNRRTDEKMGVKQINLKLYPD